MIINHKLLIIIFLSVIGSLSAQFQDMLNLSENDTNKQDKKPETRVLVKLMHNSVGVGQSSIVAVIMDIPENQHFYANENSGGIGLPTEMKVEPVEGLEFGTPTYPKGHEYKDMAGNIDMVYEKEVTIYLPVKNVGIEENSQISLNITLDGQYCTESGQCFLWDDSVSAELKIDPELEMPDINEDSASFFDGMDAESYFQGKDVESANAQQSSGEDGWILIHILAALGAGVIMNLMPCVLPVIPLKVMSIIKQGQQAKESGDNFKSFKLSLAFAAGIILLFAVLGLILSIYNLNYGQQFQNFTFKLSMFLLVYIMGLSMFGLFEITLPSSIANIGAVKEGYMGTFMMGIMATLLATPCSAPFLGGTLFWALNSSAITTLIIFICIGIGMAAPYVILTAFPDLLNKMPTAGAWMIRLKEGLSFLMFGVAVYLATLFRPAEIIPLLSLAVAIAFGLWLSFKVVNFTTPTGKKYIVRAIAAAVILFTGVIGFGDSDSIGYLILADKGSSYSEIIAAKEKALDEGKVVYLEFTANWCPNCKYVEKTVLDTEAFAKKMNEVNAGMIIADWTQKDDAIKAELNRLGSKSIPFTAVFHPEKPDEPILLRDIYSLQSALDALDGKR